MGLSFCRRKRPLPRDCRTAGSGSVGERAGKRRSYPCLLHDGDKTQKSWKPLLNTILLSEAYRNAPCNVMDTIFSCQPAPPSTPTPPSGKPLAATAFCGRTTAFPPSYVTFTFSSPYKAASPSTSSRSALTFRFGGRFFTALGLST